MRPNFAEMLKAHQISWALENGFNEGWLEPRNNQPSWVLEKTQERRNLFKPEWWCYIEGKEHRWARALNSSQCFAVNAFAPLAEDSGLASQFFQKLFPHRELSSQAEIVVEFEYAPDNSSSWLGENPHRQGTQVDVALLVLDGKRCIGQALIEVKLSEREFGSCRGYDKTGKGKNGNP
ncbi:MAG: hypothetical protein QF675_12475, partial [SAR324 cluster bacterium]|nr:hypothetical protein [SAR324 cluster bacterium]